MIEYITYILNNSVSKDIYAVVITVICIGFIFKSMYNKIKYICLEKASEKIAEVEELKDLTGEEKFALVICWINNNLPSIFKNAAMQTLIEKLVNIAYNSAFKYARNYIKRKTGYDISELLNIINNADKEAKNELPTEADKK